MNRSSKNRLTEKELFLFPGETLFDKIARAVCRAGTLPRKELFESWETAKRVRRLFRGGRVVDLACGHGLTAHIMLLLDNTSQEAIAVDYDIPKNAARLSESLIETWPHLKGRIRYIEKPIQEIDLFPQDIVISVHACGELTDIIINKAIDAKTRLAVLPCCHEIKQSDTGGFEGWMDETLAVDVMRALVLKNKGYHVIMKEIPKEISPKNRLLIGDVVTLSNHSQEKDQP